MKSTSHHSPRTLPLILILLLSAGVPISQGLASQDTIRVSTDLAIDLIDGSHIIGHPAFSAVSLLTGYAEVEIPLKHIRAINFHDNHETANVHFINGDRLTGVFNASGPLEITTLWGRLPIDIQHLKRAHVRRHVSLPQSLKDALVLYFPFDKNAQTIKDESGKGNHGTNHGASFTPHGMVNGAFQFNGNSHIECHDDPSLDLMETMTITCWIKPGALVTDYAAQIIHKASQDVRRNAMIALYYFGTRHGAVPGHISPHATIDGEWGAAGGFVAQQGTWCHLAVTYNGADFIFYRDAEAIGVRQRVGTLGTNDQPLFIGKGWGPRHGREMTGVLDELMIFNQALSSHEIKQLYAAQKIELDPFPQTGEKTVAAPTRSPDHRS